MTKRDGYMARASAAHARHLQRKAQAAAELERRNALLLQAWNEGATLPELAEAIGVSKQAVSYALGQPSGVRGGYQRRADRRRQGDRRQE